MPILLRGFSYALMIGLFTVSCSSARRLASTDTARPINNTSVRSSIFYSKRVYKGAPAAGKGVERMAPVYTNLHFTGTIETSSWLQFKYALLTDVPVEALGNLSLLNYMEEWYGTPYRYGGATKKGIDCSAFSSGLMGAVFDIFLPRTAKEQFETTDRIERYELHEGDLVFFNTRGGISHVGVYLVNNKFVHASLSSGVMISDMGESYFVKRYIGAGRAKSNS